jgi:1-acyl-sn-glycerol-3-phosphate acyltransferase
MLLSVFRLLRRLLGWIDLALFSVLMFVLGLLPARLIQGFYPRCFWSWCRVFVRALDVDLRIHQHHRYPLPAHYILIANHPSAFEDVGIPAAFSVYSLAKWEVQDWWLVGRIAKAAGTLFVRREQAESRRAALDAMIAAVRAGKRIALYPEGGCKGRRLHSRFLYGAFTLSLETGVPIVPVFIHYEAQEAFEWQGQTLLQKIWELFTAPNNRAHFHVYDAIDPRDFSCKQTYTDYVYRLYQGWQQQYLE